MNLSENIFLARLRFTLADKEVYTERIENILAPGFPDIYAVTKEGKHFWIEGKVFRKNRTHLNKFQNNWLTAMSLRVPCFVVALLHNDTGITSYGKVLVWQAPFEQRGELQTCGDFGVEVFDGTLRNLSDVADFLITQAQKWTHK